MDDRGASREFQQDRLGTIFGVCEGCGSSARLRLVELSGEDWWLCSDCRTDERMARRLGASCG